MRIGLDFDNTIVCYDKAIGLLAEDLFDLPEGVPRTKLGLRDHLRSKGREPEWTAFQGELYGPGMRYAQPFEGAVTTMHQLAAEGHELFIISHRSRVPYAGPRHDLHAAARSWVAHRLQCSGLFTAVGDEDCVHFLETRDQKLEMISRLGCEVFLDDLPEVLNAPGFPAGASGILFDPSGVNSAFKENSAIQINSWVQLPQKLYSR
jgi:hypothetical protein